THVASYSSTMHGPGCPELFADAARAKSPRSMIGVSRQPRSGPKYTRRDPPARPGPKRSTRSLSGTRGRSGMPWPTTRRLTISTGSSVPVRPRVPAPTRLVRPRQRADVDRTSGDGHGQLERLALVAAIGRPPDLHGRAGETFRRELSARLSFHSGEDLPERRRLDTAS